MIVWQRAIEFVTQVYRATNQGELKRDFGLRDQMRRAAVSIPTNIAEGFERASRKEYLLFLNIAKGSASETRSLFWVAMEIGYLNKETHDELRGRALTLSRYLFNQIKDDQKWPPRP